MSNNLLDLQ